MCGGVQVVGFGKDIAKGVKYLHSLRPMIIHRDLKSSNLLVSSNGEGRDKICKISDFGLSRIKNESVTKISGMLGTPGVAARGFSFLFFFSFLSFSFFFSFLFTPSTDGVYGAMALLRHARY